MFFYGVAIGETEGWKIGSPFSKPPAGSVGEPVYLPNREGKRT